MNPIYLYNAQLNTALGPDLASATAAYLQNQRPTAHCYELHEVKEKRPYFCASTPKVGLDQHLAQQIQATLANDNSPLSDCLLVLASTTLDIGEMEAQMQAGEPFSEQLSTALDRIADGLQQRFGFAAAYSLNTACTSAANALLYAARLIDSQHYRRALILAFETPCLVASQGFAALGLVSPSADYRPFHPERDGLILGEAYASVMLCAERPSQPLSCLLGGFSACDTSNLTTTREDGSHIHWVMQQALSAAQCQAHQIDLIKLHGTATGANDVAEANGMRLMYPHSMPAAVLLKPYLGHTLGACGLSESLLLLSALGHSALPSMEYAEHALLPLPHQPIQCDSSATVLCNFFGFGGNNASLVFQGVGA